MRPSGVLPVLFVHAKRINSFSFQRTSRFYKPRFSSPQWRLRTNKIKTFENFYILFFSHKKYDKKALPCREKFEVLQTSNQHTKLQLRTNPIKSFCRSAAFEAFRLHGKLAPFGAARSVSLFPLLFVPKSRPKRASNRRFDALFFIQSKALASQAFG